MKYCVLIFLFIGFKTVNSQVLNPVKWSFESVETNDNLYEVSFLADIDEGWIIYSQHTKEGGPIPTSFYFEENQNIELLGNVRESENTAEVMDEMFGMKIIKFNGDAVFKQLVRSFTKENYLEGYLTFMCCDGSKCLAPKNVSFKIKLD